MAHLQYMPGDPRLVDQLVYELKSKGIFDQFRKDCIADVDTRPAYQNLRQRVESSVSNFLSRQTWQPDLNKNQLREKLRKHILDGNYLEQGVERIVDQVVNPKVASVFIPKVEDLVYNYLGITKKKSPVPETSNGKIEDLLPEDLEAVSPGSVKSNEDKNESIEVDGQEETNMEVDEEEKSDVVDNVSTALNEEKPHEIQLPCDVIITDKIEIPLPDDIKTENIPEPKKMEVEKIELPKEPIVSTDIPLPDDILKEEKDDFFKPINSDDDSSSDSSLRRNMSPLTPIRNYNNENSYDAQQAFENESVGDNNEDKREPNSFRFTIEAKSPENSSDMKPEKKTEPEQLAYQFNNQVNINTPLYEDSSNSNILHIDYESDANSKVNLENKDNDQNSKDSKKEHKTEEKRSSHKSSHRSRDSHKHSNSKDKRSDSRKQSSSRDSSRHDKNKSKDESKPKSSDKEKSRDRSDRKDSRDSSRHRSSHKSSHKDSKPHRSSSSSQRHSNKEDKKSSSQKDKERGSDKSDKSKDSKSSSQKSDKDRKSSSKSERSKSKHDDKDKDKKNKKETDDHYSVSGRGNPNRRSTDRDSNDGSSSSKGSHNQSSSKSSNGKKESKSSSKSETTSTSGDSTSPSDKENVVHHGTTTKDLLQHKPIIRIESHLETPMASPPRLPFVPDVTIRKPKFAANLEEAKRLMKMRKFLDEEQKRMNQEAALLLEFQANVRPSLSQVYSSIPGPELEFACITNSKHTQDINSSMQEAHYTNNQLLTVLNDACEEEKSDVEVRATTSTEPIAVEIHGTEHPALSQNLQDDIYSALDKNHEDEVADHDSIVHETTLTIDTCINGQENLRYFDKNEQYDAEMESAKFTSFFIDYKEKTSDKLYLINCDPYEENIVRDVSRKFGQFEIVNYIKNGHLKLPSTNVIRNVNISTEISLPIEADYEMNGSESPKSQIFSPGKSECSFDLSSDYDAKLTEMVKKTSRQQIMEIILGNALDSSPSKMPRIDYFTDSNIEAFENNMKRKISEETTVNNNIQVLAPNKIRKLSTDQITSTTQEIEEIPTNKTNCPRSKYLGKARRVGLPRPRKTLLPNSPSSDKSVENYEQNTPSQSPNGKIKRNKVQRYDTSDLYKPKLHFLSRRNNHIT